MLSNDNEPLTSASWRKLASKLEQKLREAQMLEVVPMPDQDQNGECDDDKSRFDDEKLVVVYVLMPNGNMITANPMLNATFFEIKEVSSRKKNFP